MYVELDGRGARYEQLARVLKRAIVEGRLAAGTRLPATRQLANELGLSRNTVLTAYELLCSEQLAIPRVGSGTYVANVRVVSSSRRMQHSVPPQSRYAARLRRSHGFAVGRAMPQVRYDLQYGEPLLNPPLMSAWRTHVSRAIQRAPLGYPPIQGVGTLREQIASYLARRRGVTCDPDDVLIVSGTQQAVSLIARVLLNERDVAAVEDPHYQLAGHALRVHGARVVSVPVDAEGLDIARLPPEARVVFVTPSHQFPSGVVMSLQRRLELLQAVVNQRAWIIEDDYDGEFRYDARFIPALRSLDTHDRVIYVGTFSKVVFPALRLAYIVCPQALRMDLIAAKRLEDVACGCVEQHAMAEFMRSGAFERHLRKARTELRRRRTVLMQGLRESCGSRIEIADSNAGMHLIVWLPGLSAQQLTACVEECLARGLGVRSIHPYYERQPARQGVLLGFAGLSVTQLRAAVKLFAATIAQVHGRRRAP